MSDTPRTDEQAGYPDGSGCWKYTELGLYVDADFARQLERENARLRWKYTELGLYVDADFARLRSELEAKMEDGYSPRLPNMEVRDAGTMEPDTQMAQRLRSL